MDGLAPSERPKQDNAKKISVLDGTSIEKLVAAATTERWRAAIGLAGYADLRFGEVLDRADRTWISTLTRSPSRAHCFRTAARSHRRPRQASAPCPCSPLSGVSLVESKLRSPWTGSENYVLCTHDAAPVQQRNAQRALDDAERVAGFDGGEERLRRIAQTLIRKHAGVRPRATSYDPGPNRRTRDAGFHSAFTPG